MPDFLREIAYRLMSRAFHHPRLLRLLADLMRTFPHINLLLPTTLVSTRDAVAALTRRTEDFSHTAYDGNLVAGPFVIGKDDRDAVIEDRTILRKWLPADPRCPAHVPLPAKVAGSASLAKAHALIHGLRDQGRTSIDLIDEYMMEIVWSELVAILGAEANAILGLQDAENLSGLLSDLRRLGAHLVVGWIAPENIQKRAEECAKRVRTQILDSAQRLAPSLDAALNDETSQRFIGMLWVGHPATVQAGSLLLQELFERPEIHAPLSTHALRLGSAAWTDPAFRALVRDYVLELLRFRPIFPFLPRVALRDCLCDVGGGLSVQVKAGDRVVAMTAGAVFDPGAMWAPEVFRPGRYREGWARYKEDELMMFGFGERQCVAHHVVVETLTSALTGMLTLPGLRWAERRLFEPRMKYDGVTISHMYVAFDPIG